jgi:hypothetical protein
MNDLIVMPEMPGPNVRGAQHCRREVVARTLVNCHLAVILSVWRAQGICPEVRRVAGEVVTVLVIKNAGIVRSVGAIRAARRLHQRSILKQISTWAKVDLPVGRNWFVLVQIVMLRGQPIVTALKGQATIAALQAVTNACSFRDRMMSIHNGRDPWQTRRTQLTKQAVDIRRNQVEMKVRIHLSEVRCLDVSPSKLGFRERDTAFEELR